MGVVQEWDLSLLGTLGGALGDATRFSIYKHVVTSSEPISAGETAQEFGLHRTVARSHLEKLAEAGLVQVGTRRNPRGGRPAKVYSLSSERLEIQLPPRRYETLSAMLIRLASRLNGQTAQLAEEVGCQFGREAAAGLRGGRYLPDGQLNLDAIVAFLSERGCRPKAIVARDRTIVVEINNCLYLELARDYSEVVCGLSTGMLGGLLDADPAEHRQTASIIAGDDRCVHEWRRPS
jgi:predicted ArsR family transcriptional regulator